MSCSYGYPWGPGVTEQKRQTRRQTLFCQEILTDIIVLFKGCNSVSEFILIKVWFNICYLNICFIRVQLGYIYSVAVFDDGSVFCTKTIRIKTLKKLVLLGNTVQYYYSKRYPRKLQNSIQRSL